jgi:hypothetical protein
MNETIDFIIDIIAFTILMLFLFAAYDAITNGSDK